MRMQGMPAGIALLLVSSTLLAQPSIDTDGDSLRADLARIAGLENEKRAETLPSDFSGAWSRTRDRGIPKSGPVSKFAGSRIGRP